MSEKKPFSGVDDRVRLADVVPLDTPFALNLFPSNVCNFKCSYCAQSVGRTYLERMYQMKGEMMSLPMVEQIIAQSQAFPRPYKLISFMGHGEPLCNQELPQMIKHIKQAGIADRVDIITNASLLTRQTAEALIDAGLDVLRVSLQGITSESYYKTCGVKIDFEQFLSQLQYFYEIKGACKLFVKTMNVTLEGEAPEKFYRMFDHCTDRMFIDQVKPVYQGVTYSGETCDLTENRYGHGHDKREVCAQPFYMLSIWPDGQVAPCCAIYKANPLGNIKASTLFQMWNSDSLLRFRKLHLNCARNTDPACRQCCAPDDVQLEADVLDGDRMEIIERLDQSFFPVL